MKTNHKKRASEVRTWTMGEEELIRLRELPSLPPTGSDGQMLKPPFKIPKSKRKEPKHS